jgi:hypothetical protein
MAVEAGKQLVHFVGLKGDRPKASPAVPGEQLAHCPPAEATVLVVQHHPLFHRNSRLSPRGTWGSGTGLSSNAAPGA